MPVIQPMRVHEENVVSLRTAFFTDDGVVGFLFLTPPAPDRRPDRHLYSSICWVYKRHRGVVDRLRGCWKHYRDASVLPLLKTSRVSVTPKISFLWSESGHSVAVCVEGEPMAFIAEHKHHGYSKALKKPGLGNTWDEDLFHSIFKA